MSRGPDLTTAQRNNIIGAHEKGAFFTEISKSNLIHGETVQDTPGVRDRRPLEQIDQSRPGRPRKTTRYSAQRH